MLFTNLMTLYLLVKITWGRMGSDRMAINFDFRWKQNSHAIFLKINNLAFIYPSVLIILTCKRWFVGDNGVCIRDKTISEHWQKLSLKRPIWLYYL